MKQFRLRATRWFASLMHVPIRVADDYWLKEIAPSANSPPQEGNEATAN